MDAGFDVLEVNEFGVEDKDWSEAEVSADGVEKASFLGMSKKVQEDFGPFRNWVECSFA
jgi:hypothetical protein